MKETPTKRTLNLLRKNGWECQIVEHWNSFAKIRQDLFGFIDILALRESETLGVQTTSRTNINSRINKIRISKNYKIVKDAGWRIEVHGWGKLKSGWRCKIIEL